MSVLCTILAIYLAPVAASALASLLRPGRVLFTTPRSRAIILLPYLRVTYAPYPADPFRSTLSVGFIRWKARIDSARSFHTESIPHRSDLFLAVAGTALAITLESLRIGRSRDILPYLVLVYDPAAFLETGVATRCVEMRLGFLGRGLALSVQQAYFTQDEARQDKILRIRRSPSWLLRRLAG